MTDNVLHDQPAIEQLEKLQQQVKQDRPDQSALNEGLQDDKLWQQVSDLGELAEATYLATISGGDESTAEALRQGMRDLEKDLASDRSSALERILVQRISLNWLQVHHGDLMVVEMGRDNPAELKRLSIWRDRAHRRLLAAIKSLATVRKLLNPNNTKRN